MCIGNKNLRKKLLSEFHDCRLALHQGIEHTYEQIKGKYFWNNLKDDVTEYINSCDKCQCIKNSRLPKQGLLQSLEIPENPWESISIDFIVDLPRSKNKNNSILVVIDRLTKMAHFLPTTTNITSKETAQLFFNNIVRLHGYPKSIISDRDSKFTASFWQELAKLTGTQLKMSTAWHAQTDGQTERTNQTLETTLRSAINHKQDNWEELLPACEFTHNNNINKSTGYLPFKLNYGYDPVLPSNMEISRTTPTPAIQFIKEQKELIKNAKLNIEKANKIMQKYYNRNRVEIKWEPGQKILISRDLTTPPYLQGRQNRSLQDHWHGPYEILEQIGKNAVKIKLPQDMKIHPVISNAFIKEYKESERFTERIKEKPPPVEINGNLEYEVEEILNKRIRYRKI